MVSCLAHELPVKDGLVLWLDASVGETLKVDEKGRVTEWNDRREKGVIARSDHPPALLQKALGGRDVLRFEGRQSFKIQDILKGAREATVFIVFRRPETLAGHQEWQKVVTHGGGDTEGIHLSTEKKSGVMSTRVLRGGFHQNLGDDLYIGTGSSQSQGELWGDIAEVLVYSRGFYVEEPMSQVVSYLEKKWAFKEDRSNDWTRVGPLPDTPKRISEKLPLSDQENAGKWSPYQEMWDEFGNSEIDSQKWWNHNPTWFGRPPARYLAREVTQKEDELQIFMRKDPSLKEERFYGSSVYKDYSSGTLKSKKATLYGYFEIEAQAMASAGSSAWWFTGESRDREKKNGRTRIEIDVFELGGRSKGREQTYSMNLHVFRTPSSRRHWNRGGEWEAPFKFADGFHVFGLEWTPQWIRYYVDGVLVRSVANEAWHSPMYMLFDSETMIDWLGVPEDKDLPSIFRVKYVRAWKNTETNPEWWKRHSMRNHHRRGDTRATKYVREMAKKKP